MLDAIRTASAKNMQYAVAADFCRIFEKDMNSLYLLSLLLTGDHEKAEQCFVAGLDSAVKRNTVFKEWARSWARRVIIQNAVRIINPRPSNQAEVVRSASSKVNGSGSEQAEIAAVLGLRSFDRFVFVMSVLDDYSDQDCAILLGCTRRDVAAARTHALQQIGSAAEFLRAQKAVAQELPVLPRGDNASLEPEMFYAKFA